MKKYEKMFKNGQKMAEIKNPFKFLLLTFFALYMPKIMRFGQKTKKRYHNCPTQQYMTGPLFFYTSNGRVSSYFFPGGESLYFLLDIFAFYL